MSDSRRRLIPYAALIGLALIWGGSFLAIKVTVQDMSPTALLLFRSASGFVALAVIVIALRKPLFGPGWRGRLIGFGIMAVTNAVIPWVSIGWGEERISSGLASILNSTTTLWTAVLIYWVMPTERPSFINYVGVVVGFAGVVVLVYPELSTNGLSGDVLGALLGIVGPVDSVVVVRDLERVALDLAASVGDREADALLEDVRTEMLVDPLVPPLAREVQVELAQTAATHKGLSRMRRMPATGISTHVGRLSSSYRSS